MGGVLQGVLQGVLHCSTYDFTILEREACIARRFDGSSAIRVLVIEVALGD